MSTSQALVPIPQSVLNIIYSRLSIYRGYIGYDCAHRTIIKMIKFRSDLHSRTTPHTSTLRANYGVSFVSYTKKNDRDISGAHCTNVPAPWELTHTVHGVVKDTT